MFNDQRIAYTEFGGGPAALAGDGTRTKTSRRASAAQRPVILVHGLLLSQKMHRPLAEDLAARGNRVITLDLLGHGRSDKPRADYSVAAYANGVRDLLGVLGVTRTSLIGHSLGGGVAMQFAYQFPERTERLVLVGSGGGGPEVCAALRLLTLPGAQALLHLLRLPTAAVQLRLLVALLRTVNAPLGLDAPDLLRVVTALPDATARAAFIRSLRSVVDWRGQVITMLDRCYLVYGTPTLLIWGGRDAIVPLEHGYRAHRAMPGSQLEIFAHAGHFPFHTEPARFVATVERFIAATQPARWNAEQWRQLLRSGPLTPSAMAEAHGVSGAT